MASKHIAVCGIGLSLTFWGARLHVRHLQAGSCCYLFDVHLIHSETDRLACLLPAVFSNCLQRTMMHAADDATCGGNEA